MTPAKQNKKKIFNDPIYGFISIPFEIILDLIDHPYFQRLRRIKQLGLSHLVYPGALHTRFHHAVGCTHLMKKAVENLRERGQEITPEESEAVCIAILLHDIGHGPFSHALEHSLVHGVTHEDISTLVMQELNKEFNGRLTLAIEIFENRYPKKFLHQLVSSQLDMDRLDYLKRDSFYSGVSEGVISSDRIIEMLDVVNDSLAVQQKGIYSVEKFIVARRLMYWQVYLHKTVLAAEFMLVNILKRAKELTAEGKDLFASPALKSFLQNHYTCEDFKARPDILKTFMQLDDFDIMGAIKVWTGHEDLVLSELSRMMVNRQLLKIEIDNSPIDAARKQGFLKRTAAHYGISEAQAAYFVFADSIANNAYNPASDRINILFKDDSLKDITEASDNLNIQALSQPVRKHFMCYPEVLRR
ncbi:MAG: HD domain-containing protein [Flavobacteriales bacterium]